jgi:hypothetical protein
MIRLPCRREENRMPVVFRLRRPHDQRLQEVVEQRRSELEEAWNDYFA